MKNISAVAVTSLAYICLQGCASQTRITTEVNATIYEVQTGRAVGTAAADYKDRKPFWSSTSFRIEKEGCKTKNLTIHRNDSINAGRTIGGFFFILPWIWIGDYEPSYGVSLECGRTEGAGH